MSLCKSIHWASGSHQLSLVRAQQACSQNCECFFFLFFFPQTASLQWPGIPSSDVITLDNPISILCHLCSKQKNTGVWNYGISSGTTYRTTHAALTDTARGNSLWWFWRWRGCKRGSKLWQVLYSTFEAYMPHLFSHWIVMHETGHHRSMKTQSLCWWFTGGGCVWRLSRWWRERRKDYIRPS